MSAPHMDDFDLAGLQPTRARAGAWPEAAKMAVAGGAGCSLIVLMEFLLIWFLVQAMFSVTVPEGLVVRVTAPPQAQQGKAVPLFLVVRNEGDQAFTVRGVVMRSSTRKNFALDHFRPAPIAPRTSLLGTESWVYRQTVAPGKSWSVQLDATPRQLGKLRGTLEVQVDRGVRQARFEVNVLPAGSGKDDAKPQPTGEGRKP